ncbi:hypothetical protein V2I01_19945 [Micromonospora sp. BRA006-A]|nr:hypothetical protein [Micromonospora sp. BRA006-A]
MAGKVAPQARAGVPLGAGADADLRAGLRLAADDPAALLTPAHEAEALALFGADGPALDELCRLADDARRDAVGDDVTYVVNRNINFTNVCYVGCRFCAFAQRRATPTRSGSRSSRWPTGPRRRGPQARPRSASRAASTRRCR